MAQSRPVSHHPILRSSSPLTRSTSPPMSSGQLVVMPNRAPSTRHSQTILVEVTSRDRNYLQRVSSNPIRFQFARPLKDVRSVELLSGTIPAHPYNIVKGANHLTFVETSLSNVTTTFNITITPGLYTETTLISMLNTLFASLFTINTYTWSQSSTGSAVLTRIGGTASFGLLFVSGTISDVIDRSDGYFLQQNTIALQLGFDMSDYYSDGTSVITSPYPMDLVSSINRLYLYINLDNTQDLGVIERGAGRRWPFAILYLDQETNGYKYLNKDTLSPIMYSLPQPMGRLQNLNIEFRDEWNRVVDFNGKDFSLLLQITTLE